MSLDTSNDLDAVIPAKAGIHFRSWLEGDTRYKSNVGSHFRGNDGGVEVVVRADTSKVRTA
jgi:hypothetical protein